MNSSSCVASCLQPRQRQDLALKVLSKKSKISHLAHEEGVSRKFLYQQQDIAQKALNTAFEKSESENEVLYYLPITHSWIFQLILALILICHCSYRGVKEILGSVDQLLSVLGKLYRRGRVRCTQPFKECNVWGDKKTIFFNSAMSFLLPIYVFGAKCINLVDKWKLKSNSRYQNIILLFKV